MVEDEKRRRAPAMSQEERRESIVRSTLPLLMEHGGTVSTSQIAAAAGIAEGTVFRAFKDKQDLLVACMRAAMDSDAEVDGIERIDPGRPLAERLTDGVHAVGGYLDRIWTITQALQAAGISSEDVRKHVHDQQEGEGPPKELLRVSKAIAGLFDGAGGTLRVDRDRAAQMLLGLVFTNRMRGPALSQATTEPAELVDLFLHGVSQPEKGKKP